MATCTFQSGGVDLNWSTVGNWDTQVPLADDIVIIPTGLAAVMDVVRVPATAGSLTSLTTVGTGNITVDMAARSYSINVTGAIGCAHTTAGINVSGAPGTNTFEMTYGSLAPTATTAIGLLINSAITSGCTLNGPITAGSGINSGTGAKFSAAATIVINGSCTGGTVGVAVGVLNNSANVTLNGDCTGGGSTSAHGFQHNAATGTLSVAGTRTLTGGTGAAAAGLYVSNNGAVTLDTAVIIVNGTGGMGYAGKPPATWTVAAASTWTMGATTWAPVVGAANLKKDIVNGTVTGTYAFNVNGISVTGPA